MIKSFVAPKRKKVVLQIVDSPRRDLEWRLYLAYLLAKKGVTSIIGSPSEIELYCNICSNALLIGRFGGNTGRSKFDVRLVRTLKKNNISMFFLHDEGAFYFEGEPGYERAVKRVYPGEYLKEDFFKRMYFWGIEQRKYFSDDAHAEKLQILGSPRFDLFRQKYKYIDESSIQEIKDKFGDFVLICSRFGGLSPVPGDVSLLSKRLFEIRKEGLAGSKVLDAEIMSDMIKVWKNVTVDRAYFLDAIYDLCKSNPEVKYVYRPHPSEMSSLYVDVFRRLPNVTVDKGGDLRPLLRASSMMIHSESTSGIEAEFCETPTINYINELDEDNMSIVGTKFAGYIVRSPKELERAFKELMSYEGKVAPNYSAGRSQISRHVANYLENQEAITTLAKDVTEYFKLSAASEFNSIRKAFIWEEPIARYWAKRLLVTLKGLRRFGRRRGDEKVVAFGARYTESLWRKFGGGAAQLKVSESVIIVAPYCNETDSKAIL